MFGVSCLVSGVGVILCFWWMNSGLLSWLCRCVRVWLMVDWLRCRRFVVWVRLCF